MEVSQQYRDENEDIYQPKWKGRATHRHALYTAAFLERYRQYMPKALFSTTWGDGDILLNLASCHHKPETPLQWLVTMADRISSGLDEA